MLFVATAEALDDDMSRRIAAHRLRRPVEWSTLEEPMNLAPRLPSELHGYDTCLLDLSHCLGQQPAAEHGG